MSWHYGYLIFSSINFLDCCLNYDVFVILDMKGNLRYSTLNIANNFVKNPISFTKFTLQPSKCIILSCVVKNRSYASAWSFGLILISCIELVLRNHLIVGNTYERIHQQNTSSSLELFNCSYCGNSQNH